MMQLFSENLAEVWLGMYNPEARGLQILQQGTVRAFQHVRTSLGIAYDDAVRMLIDEVILVS